MQFRLTCLLALVVICAADQSFYSIFFKKVYAGLGSKSVEEVAAIFGDEFAELNKDGRLADFLYDMLQIRKADLLTSLNHIDRLGIAIDTLVEINRLNS